MDLIQYFGGIGGIAAILIIIIRYLVNQMREDRKFMEDRLTRIIDSYNGTTSDNTKVLTELITWLRAKNGGK